MDQDIKIKYPKGMNAEVVVDLLLTVEYFLNANPDETLCKELKPKVEALNEKVFKQMK